MKGRGMSESPDARSAPERFIEWMTAHEHIDRKNELTYHYHPRSDAHSVALSRFIAADLVRMTPALGDALHGDGRTVHRGGERVEEAGNGRAAPGVHTVSTNVRALRW